MSPSPTPLFLSLERVEDAAVARVEARLRERTCGTGGGGECLEARGHRGSEARARDDADPRLGQDAERALGADEQALGRRAGAGRGQPARRGRRSAADGAEWRRPIRRCARRERRGSGRRPCRDPLHAEASRTRTTADSGGEVTRAASAPPRARVRRRRSRSRAVRGIGVDLAEAIEACRGRSTQRRGTRQRAEARLDRRGDRRSLRRTGSRRTPSDAHQSRTRTISSSSDAGAHDVAGAFAKSPSTSRAHKRTGKLLPRSPRRARERVLLAGGMRTERRRRRDAGRRRRRTSSPWRGQATLGA